MITSATAIDTRARGLLAERWGEHVGVGEDSLAASAGLEPCEPLACNLHSVAGMRVQSQERVLHGSKLFAMCTVLLLACKSEPHRQTVGPASGTTQSVGQTWDLCPWLGPTANRTGIFGSDLGYAVGLPRQNGVPDQLELLFGDTWAQAADACQYPVLKSDDFAGRIPAQRPATLAPGPPPSAANDACNALQYTLDDAADPTSWRRIRLFPDAGMRTDDRVLDTGMLRTPVTAWSDGAHTFAIYIREQYQRCHADADCPSAMACTSDSNYHGKHIGGCKPQVSLASDASPDFCRDDSDCSSPSLCLDLDQGLCVAKAPFTVQRDGQAISPPWYDDDPRKGEASIMYIASAFWPDRAEDFATGFQFVTNKFSNVTARTVAHFDPQQPDDSDYSPGTETLLLWGRPAFIGSDGFQALPFLLYQPLAGLLDDSGAIAWAPHYFAGYDDAGNPRWSDVEADAQPLYGVDENLVQQNGQWTWNWQAPEFDYVNQMSMLWAAPLQRWLMLYGGETPATTDPSGGTRPPPTYAQAVPGAIYLRAARHPFGRSRASAPSSEAFSTARPVLTRAAIKDQLACDDDHQGADCTANLHQQPGSLLDSLVSAGSELSPGDFLNASAKCVAGTAALGAQYSVGDDSAGHLYGTSIIDAWTQELPDSQALEFYWNVSTWNPYQVRLLKTRIGASELNVSQ